VPDPAFLEAAAALGVTGRTAGILAARGVNDAEALEHWFAPPAAALHDPALLPDAAVVVERIRAARQDRERVLVFGDFDADGLSGLAVLTLALRRLGLAAEPYVPSRLQEGHGLSLAAVEAAVARGAGLIVTVDCGTTSVTEIAAAVAAGIDVIVTDHHRVPAVLPDALAIVNPHRPDSRYPDRRLSGSGVAFKLAQLLLADEAGGPAFARSLADLAMIGTVADVAPILGENRAIARLGLDEMRSSPRPGIAALLRRSGIAPALVDLETISFAIAPRINAAGRVGEAEDAARLLLADDPAEASALAERIETNNLERRGLTKAAIAAARTSLGEAGTGEAAVVLRGPWGVGIVGLVAARLADDSGLPAVVGADLGDIVRASCRGDGRLNLAATLEACADLLLRHGGHAGAAGFEIGTDQWETFRTRFLLLAGLAPPPDPRPVVQVDLAIPALAATYELYREIARLAPWGTGNPAPLIAVLGLTVTRVREANGGHTQLTLRRERDVLDGIAFQWPELAAQVREGDRVDVLGRLASRTFGGFETLQLEIRDVARSGSMPEAAAILSSTGLAGGSVPVAGG
jgi:single-stranded-DNA-specific exonuclease